MLNASSARNSEQQVAERTAAYQQSEQNIRTVFETSYMNQGLASIEGKIIYVNATALASIGAKLEDVVGRDFWDTPWFTATPGMPEKVARRSPASLPARVCRLRCRSICRGCPPVRIFDAPRL